MGAAGEFLDEASCEAMVRSLQIAERHQYPGMTAELAKALSSHEFEKYATWLVPRPYRPLAFVQVENRLSDQDYWRVLRDLWIDTEFPGRCRSLWLDFFMSRREGRSELMKPAEHTAFAALPDRVRIYRGAHPKHARGMSWTTERAMAEWFAKRFDRDDAVFTTVTPKTKIVAYFLGRGESEVVIDPRRLGYELFIPPLAMVAR